MRETVVIVGGGVAGLSAAHELIRRGFDVHIYERRAFLGGKAASYRLDEGAGPPGEHGFRFFPSWYRHLIDTMERIPYHRPQGGRRMVADNLVEVPANTLAWFDRAPVPLPVHLPLSGDQAVMASESFSAFLRLGLTPGEMAFFFKKIVDLTFMSDERRLELFEGISWWEYLGCSQTGRSRAFKDLVRATTRTLVAAKAEEASAYTIGRLAIRSLLDTLSNVDRVLNGPTNEVWIDPWVAHLKAQGVVFHLEMELQSIEFDSGQRKVRHLVVEPVPVANARRLRKLILRQRRNRRGFTSDSLTDAQELASELSNSRWLAGQGSNDPDGHLSELRYCLREVSTSRIGGDWSNSPESARLLGHLAALETSASQDVGASYFMLALPLEQVAYHVNRTTMLPFLAPETRNIVRLSRHMDWMAGIQFYLGAPLDVSPGHIIGVDSTWALTAIEQTQFWKDISLPDTTCSILSVDISAWDKKGRITRKEAYNCNNEEIAREVWGELKEMLNKGSRADVLRDDMLVGGELTAGVSFHLDDSIVDLRDPKKQAFYERARGLKFNTLDLVAKDEGEASTNAAQSMDQSYMWGPHRRFNTEPLLVNRPGSHALRPEASTSIPNLFLAGDYIRTETDLACMEGANEAARRAVNGILDAAASLEPRCQIWPFSPSRQAAESLTSVTGVLRVVQGAATAVTQLQDQFWKRLACGLMQVRGGSVYLSNRKLGPPSGRS